MALSTIQNNSFADTAVHGYRNLIINGAMRVAQRATSVTGATSGYNTIDRWAMSFDGDNDNLSLNMEQSSDAPDGFNNSLKLTVATPETTVEGDEQASIQYRIEAQDLQGLAFGTSTAKAFTVSFWVKSSVTGTFALNAHNIDADRIITDTFSINTANTWEYKYITLVGDTSGSFNDDNGIGLQLVFFLMAGPDREGTSADTWRSWLKDALATGINNNLCTTSGATFQITGVQLEVGSEATPFEHRPYADELRRCQRYFQKWDVETTLGAGLWFSANQVLGHLGFRTIMRASPTMSVSSADFCKGYLAAAASNANDSGSPFDIININAARFNLNMVSTGTNGQGCLIQLNSSEYIHADAEL